MNAYYQEGYDACAYGLSSFSACPYRRHTLAASEWYRGYNDQLELEYWVNRVLW